MKTKRNGSLRALGLVAVGLGLMAILAAASAAARSASHRRRLARAAAFGYDSRSGWPRQAADMRGAAGDFDVPADMRIPRALRPYTVA